MTELTEYANQPFEVKVSYKEQYIYTEDQGPSLILLFDSGFQVSLTSGETLLTWIYSGGISPISDSGFIATPFAMDQWYDWRIQIVHHSDMQKYVLNFEYKLSSSVDWIQIASKVVDATLGIPSASLGSPTLNSYSTPIDEENYWFADFSVRSIEDQDGDGLTDQEEYDLDQLNILNSTSMSTYDTDGDGLSDAEELSIDIQDLNYTKLKIDGEFSNATSHFGKYLNTYHSNPLVPDTDGDGLNDLDEKMAGSNPNKVDTDDDGVQDDVDSEPTVMDTFAPSFINIHGEIFTFGDGTVLRPLAVNESDGVYLHIEESNSNLYIVMTLYDDKGLDNLRIWSTSQSGLGDFDTPFDFEGEKQMRILFQVPVADFLFQTHTIHIQAEDVDGHQTDDYTYEIESSFSKYLAPITDFLRAGATWIKDKVGDFINWVQETVSEALNYVIEWLKDKVTKTIKFFRTKMEALAKPITDSMTNTFSRFVYSIANYESGTINEFLPTIIDPFQNKLQPVLDFVEEYDKEITIAIDIMELVQTLTSPVALIGVGLNAFGDSSLASDLAIFTTINSFGETAGSDLISMMETLFDTFNFDYSLGGLEITNLPSSSNLEAFFIDLSLTNVNGVIYNLTRGLLIGLNDMGGSSSLQLDSYGWQFDNPFKSVAAIASLFMVFFTLTVGITSGTTVMDKLTAIGISVFGLVAIVASSVMGASNNIIYKFFAPLMLFLSIAMNLIIIVMLDSNYTDLKVYSTIQLAIAGLWILGI